MHDVIWLKYMCHNTSHLRPSAITWRSIIIASLAIFYKINIFLYFAIYNKKIIVVDTLVYSLSPIHNSDWRLWVPVWNSHAYVEAIRRNIQLKVAVLAWLKGGTVQKQRAE